MSPSFLAAVAAVLAWTVAVVGGGVDFAGIPSADVATGLAFAAVALALTGWAAEKARGGWRGTVGAVVVWAGAIAGLGIAFTHRSELLETARQMGDEFGIGAPQAVVGTGGEVSVLRRADGTFAVPARVNTRDVNFLFDTGATAVVLSSDTAAALGLGADTLRFRVPVATANGRGMAAPVILDTLAVGPIVMSRVPALVTRPGMLEGNLLGHTFLDKLESYEVRGNRLVMRARGT